MAAKKPPAWQLDEADVDVGRSWRRASGRGGNIARTSRAEGTQSGITQLVHRPTGIKVEGTVPEGSYTRGEMSAAMDAVKADLLVELEKLVAHHYRLPGR